MTAAVETEAREERIYVGGLDPSRLSVEEVLHRLQEQQPRLHVLPDSVHPPPENQSSYVRFTATWEGGDDSSTPLEATKRLFHNVKWKGCKLTVEAARPPFLERLQEEIRQRKILLLQHQQNKPGTAVKQKDTANHSIPRRLRVKRGYGKTAWPVDTKPCRVDDWTTFAAVLQRMSKRRGILQREDQKRKGTQQQQQQHQKNQNRTPTLHQQKQSSFCNRAVHLRFPQNGVPRSGELEVEQGSAGVALESESSTSEVSSSSSSSSRSSPLQHPEKFTNDDSTTEDEMSSESASSSEDDDRERNDSSSHSVAHSSPPKVAADSSYVWSDDDESDESSEDQQPSPDSVRNRTVRESPAAPSSEKSSFLWTRKSVELDEFAAATEDANKGESIHQDRPVESLYDDEQCLRTQRDIVDLKHDVETNLHVLSQLFPELSTEQRLKSAVNGASNDDEGEFTRKEEEIRQRKPPSLCSGWGSSGQMLRYDPTSKDSSGRFVLTGKVEHSAQEMRGEKSDSCSDEILDSGKGREHSEGDAVADQELERVQRGTKVSQSVYEQEKLEEVFREAREAQDAPSVVAKQSAREGVAASNGRFSFGFDLGKPEEADLQKEPNGSFSFSFELPGTGSTVSHETNHSQITEVTKRKDTTELDSEQKTGSPREPRKRRIRFTDEDLDRYVKRFYSLNDGDRIIADLEGFRKDPSVKEKWNQERQTLTQDWKRKRKYGVSRKKRKFG